jgi:hypothetical protein
VSVVMLETMNSRGRMKKAAEGEAKGTCCKRNLARFPADFMFQLPFSDARRHSRELRATKERGFGGSFQTRRNPLQTWRNRIK